MKKNHEQLLRNLLQTDDLLQLRNRSLADMLSAGRARRRRRHLNWAGLCAILPACWFAAHLFTRAPNAPVAAVSSPPALSTTPSPPPQESGPATIKFITTDELLALFPDRPLALVGPPGEQELVFFDQPAGVLR